MEASTSSGEKEAARLSPPLSMKIRSRSGNQIQVRELPLHRLDRLKVHRDVVPDGGVRTVSGLDADDPALRQDGGGEGVERWVLRPQGGDAKQKSLPRRRARGPQLAGELRGRKQPVHVGEPFEGSLPVRGAERDAVGGG
jgi:hypothetical protein